MPKSQSFSTSRNLNRAPYHDMDLIEYQKYKKHQQILRQRKKNKNPAATPDELTRICDRDGCVSETCLVKNNISIINNNNHHLNSTRIINDWDIRNKNCNYRERNSHGRRHPPHREFSRDRDTLIDDGDIFENEDVFLDDDRGQLEESHPRHYRNRSFRRPYYTLQNSIDHSIYDQDLKELIQHERSKIMFRDKFDKLNKLSDEYMDDYKRSYEDIFHNNHMNNSIPSRKSHNRNFKHNLSGTKPTINNKSMLECVPPSKFDTSSDESDSTNLDLDDFNFDFEKYWDELEDKRISSDLDIGHMRNKFDDNNNIKIKNVNVDRYVSEDFVDSMRYEDYRKAKEQQKMLHNIFSIYKVNKYSQMNCNLRDRDYYMKILPPKKMNMPSTTRPLGKFIALLENPESFF